MSLVALYKCWSGEEWLRASVASILGGVDAVVLALSDVSWIGGRGNPSAKIAAELARKHSKVHVLAHDEPNQLAHCLHAYQWMQAHLPSEHVMLIDSDEVWDVAELLKAKAFLREHPEEMAYRTQMYTYIKRATLRVTPTEPSQGVAGSGRSSRWKTSTAIISSSSERTSTTCSRSWCRVT